MRLLVLLGLLFMTSCAFNEVGRTQIKPENLVSSNIEDVSFNIASEASINSIKGWILDDKPSSASLSCINGDLLCVRVVDLLDKFSIPYKTNVINGETSSLSLVYRRTVARTCNNGMGCATSTNIIHGITNQSDFTNPELSDYQDARKAVETYRNYYSKY